MKLKPAVVRGMLLMGLMVLLCALVVSGQTVENRMAVNEYPVIQLDPALVIDYYDSGVMYNLYDFLVYPTPEGSIRPHLAVDWYSSNDGKTWVFKLRQGVKFHDGTELTAEDVAFSMERMLTIGQGYSGFFSDVEDVSVSGPYEVVFNLTRPNAVFPATLAMLAVLNKDLVLQHLKPGDFGDLGDYGMDWLRNHDAGSGPYMVTEYKPGEYLLTQRFDDYWMGWESWGPDVVPIEKGLFREMTEPSTLKTLLKTREHDFTDWYQADEFYEEVDAIEGVDVIEMDVGVIYIAWLNTRRPPTDDIHFRKAICWAFDYQALVDSVRGATQAKGPIPSIFPGHDPEVFQYHRDLEEARRELAQSKYAPNQYELDLMYTAGIQIEEKIALLLQANLAELGIKVNITAAPWTRISEVVTKPELTPHVTIFMFTASYPSSDFFFTYMYHPNNTGGMYAAHWLADPELGRLIDESKPILDTTERMSLYKKIQARIMELVPAIYTVQVPAVHAKQDYIVGPKEVYPVIGPELNLRNYQINLDRKAELMGQKP